MHLRNKKWFAWLMWVEGRVKELCATIHLFNSTFNHEQNKYNSFCILINTIMVNHSEYINIITFIERENSSMHYRVKYLSQYWTVFIDLWCQNCPVRKTRNSSFGASELNINSTSSRWAIRHEHLTIYCVFLFEAKWFNLVISRIHVNML